jgi:hypothetical protein
MASPRVSLFFPLHRSYPGQDSSASGQKVGARYTGTAYQGSAILGYDSATFGYTYSGFS